MIYKPDDSFASEPAPGTALEKNPPKLGTASSNYMLKASGKIQSMFRKFKACHERKSLVHAGIQIQKFLRLYLCIEGK